MGAEAAVTTLNVNRQDPDVCESSDDRRTVGLLCLGGYRWDYRGIGIARDGSSARFAWYVWDFVWSMCESLCDYSCKLN